MALVLIQGLSWVCFLVFLVGVAAVWRRYSRMPLHLRWDLHPLPGEDTSRTKDREVPGRLSAALAEIRFALREGLLFEQCFKSNRGLWYVSYPFHLGVFASILWVVLVALWAILEPPEWWPVRAIAGVAVISGGAGFILGTVGGIGLLMKRLFDPNLRLYTAPREYANLGVLLVVFLFGFATWTTSDIDFSLSRQYARSLITVSAPPSAGSLFWATTIVFSIFLASLPFASMRHGIAKFFTYHQVRWDDEPNLRGSEMEGRIERLMTNPLTWSAPHIKCGRWKDVPDRGAGNSR
jgi:nitrate reductase gamma subunit